MIRHFTCFAFSFKPVDQFLVDQVLVAEIFLNLLYLGDETGLVKSWLFQFQLNKIQVNPFLFFYQNLRGFAELVADVGQRGWRRWILGMTS